MKSPAIVLELTENPSSDYYVMPVARQLADSVHRLSLKDLPPPALRPGTHLIIVRYLTRRWRRWIALNRSSFGRLVLFLDDDILDYTASRSLPLGYRFKVWRLCARHYEWLRRTGIELWVSTPYLAAKYSAFNPRLCLPSEISETRSAVGPPGAYHNDPPGRPIRVFYHGSSTHMPEIAWLRDVAAQAVQSNPALTFELIGNRSVKRMWAGIHNTTIVPEMTWPAYLAFSSTGRRDIGLAPLLSHPFNAARSHTKFFDITRTGAAGIYSDHPAFTSAVGGEPCGRIVQNDPESWVQTILALASDQDERNTIASVARQRVAALSCDAARHNRGLLQPHDNCQP